MGDSLSSFILSCLVVNQKPVYRAFSYDVTAAILVYQKQCNGGHIGEPSQSCGS